MPTKAAWPKDTMPPYPRIRFNPIAAMPSNMIRIATSFQNGRSARWVTIGKSPNPAINSINIQFDCNTLSGKNELFLYDVSGRKIESKVLTTCKGLIEFTQNLNPGIYFYSLVSSGKNVITNKVILK